MSLDNYLIRPTIPQIRRDKNPVVHKPGEGLEQLQELRPGSDYFLISHQVLPQSFFPSPTQVLFKRFKWDRNDAARSFLKKTPLVKAFVGTSQEDISRRVMDMGDSSLQEILYNRLETSALAPGMSFRPIVLPNKAERLIYWDQLCAGALISQDLYGTDSLRISFYDKGESVKDIGAQAHITFTQPVTGETESLTLNHIPLYRERAHIIARALYSDRQTNKTDFTSLQFSEIPHIDSKERKELDALVVAGWFGVCQEYAKNSNYIPSQTSVILHPSTDLLDMYDKLRNNTIIQVPQNQHDSSNGGEHKERYLNQAEISSILHRAIKRSPKKYLHPVSHAFGD